MPIGKRDNIRWFIQAVAWATPENIAYFLNGKSDEKLYRIYCSELFEMTQVKNNDLKLRRIVNQNGNHAFTMSSKAAKLPTFTYNHDVALRNVLGKFMHDRGRQEVSFKQPADASIFHFRFEMDNGHMNDEQLEEKICNHYRKGNIQVVFIMRSLYSEKSEEARLKKIFDISEKMFYDQPNRILGACYSQFLHNGKLYNRKGEAK